VLVAAAGDAKCGDDLSGGSPVIFDLKALRSSLNDGETIRSPVLTRREVARATMVGLLTAGDMSLLPYPAGAQAMHNDLGKVLIAYFSRTGNTRAVANQIHEAAPGDLFEIHTTYAYPQADRATIDQAQREQEESARPPLATDVTAIESYDTVFLGFPIWWTTMPMVFFTFLGQHRLAGKTVVPFCTHEGSHLGRSVTDIRTLCPNAKLFDGLALRGGSSGYVRSDAGRREIADWLRRL
jgi:flavodoxin